MLKNNRMKKIMEFRDVHYTGKTRAIRKMLSAGFSIEDICVRRVSACRYDIVAIKEV